jgi:hypothetical protein
MRTIFAPLTAAVALAMIVSMAGLMLPGTELHATARRWSELNSMSIRATAGVLSGLLHNLALPGKATDGDPHVVQNLPCR